MKYRILLADDDPDFLELTALKVKRTGAEVVLASSGADLLEHLADEGPFDLVITDITMPWMTGLQAAHSVRAAGLDVPFIVMTALTDASIGPRVRSLGANTPLLHKPFSGEELEAAIAIALTSPRTAAAPLGAKIGLT